MFTDSDRVVCVETSKNEDTWCIVLSHYDAEFDTASGLSKYAPLLAVAWKALCTFPQPDERQPVRTLWLLERGQGGVELQLARQ